MADGAGRQLRRGDLVLGHLRRSDFGLLVERADAPKGLHADYDPAEIAGILGGELFQAYDLELDLAANRFSLFLPDHCEGEVVHWPASAVAIMPFAMGRLYIFTTTHFIATMKLDGEEVKVGISPAAVETVMHHEAALKIFRLKEGVPGVQELAPFGEMKRFRYPFAALSLGEFAVRNPAVTIQGENPAWERTIPSYIPAGSLVPVQLPTVRPHDMVLGLGLLERLHIYIARKEGRVYITPAATPAAAPAP